MSRIGECSKGQHGPIQDWDVSAVTNMKGMFYGDTLFNQDISKWDVSAVTDMWFMFASVIAFNQDLSKWDVSAVADMGGMFSGASTFNQDLSNWDVSAVTEMENMFFGASVFNRELCGSAWVQSKADKTDMFIGSPGSISSTVCETAKKGCGGDWLSLGWGSSTTTCVCVCVGGVVPIVFLTFIVSLGPQ